MFGGRAASGAWSCLILAGCLAAGQLPAGALPAAPASDLADPSPAGPVLEPFPVATPPDSEPTGGTSTPPAAPDASGAPATGAPSQSSDPTASPDAAEAGAGAALDPEAVAETVAPLLSGGALGPGRTPAVVVDYLTGEVLFRSRDRPTVPASTLKLLTAQSVLAALGPDAVLRTRTAILDPEAERPRVVLVGGGDPTLASVPGAVGASGTTLTPAALPDLARATKRALGERTRVRVGYDDSLFTGPAMHPTWSSSFPASGVVAPVSALQVDQGRRTRTAAARVRDPARAAADRFVAELERLDVTVTGRVRRVTLRPESTALAAVSSPPVGVLVERMLATSDNDIAEALARLAAKASGHPASFAGVAARGEQLLSWEGVDDERAVDGSGLSRSSRLSPSTLTRLVTAGDRGQIVAGLPVAGATGSLRTRFRTDATRAAAGLVRAKTGTLTGVISLAGMVSRPDGRLLVAAFLDDSVTGGAWGARAALDRAMAALVTCSCEPDPLVGTGR